MSEIKTTKNGTTVRPQDDLTAAQTEGLREELTTLLRDGTRKITLDLAKVKHIDGYGIALIIAAFKSIERDEGVFRIKNVNKKLWPLFENSRLERYFEVTPKK